MRLLEVSLRRPGGADIPETIRRRLAASMRSDVEELHDPLMARGEARAREAEARLAERGRKEADSMRRLLEMQKAGIEKALASYGTLQMDMFAPDERRQRESEHRHQLKRLEELAHEIETEPRRVEESYRVKVPRLEPIGLVYLYPVTG